MKGSHALQVWLQKGTFKRQVQIKRRILPRSLDENEVDNSRQSRSASGCWWPKHPHTLMLAATHHNAKLNVAGLHFYISMSVTMVVLGEPNIFCFMVDSI